MIKITTAVILTYLFLAVSASADSIIYAPVSYHIDRSESRNEAVGAVKNGLSGISPIEIARLVFPDKGDEFLNFALWEKTGYPSFFDAKGMQTKCDVLMKQLIDFKGEILP